MLIARILLPVYSLGPNKRIVLWTQGCSKNCVGCISPEMQPFKGRNIEETLLGELIMKLAKKSNYNSITISGGDPFEQSESLLELLKMLRVQFKDILVYTGYTLKTIQNGEAGNKAIDCLKYIDVLIDGKYVDELNTPECVLRGSSNQQIHFLNKAQESSYYKYMDKGRMIESFAHGDETIIVGILNTNKD